MAVMDADAAVAGRMATGPGQTMTGSWRRWQRHDADRARRTWQPYGGNGHDLSTILKDGNIGTINR